MVFFIVLVALAAASTATLRIVARDGYRRVPTDPSRLP